MENIEAEVIKESDTDTYIQINFEPVIRIPISKDSPKAVKDAFCNLIDRIREENFSLALKEPEKKDLSYFVAEEYIKQLNNEIQEVYREIVRHGLSNDPLA